MKVDLQESYGQVCISRVCISRCEWLVLVCRLKEGEMEVGLGVHGEPGAFTQPMQPASAVASQVRLLPSTLWMQFVLNILTRRWCEFFDRGPAACITLYAWQSLCYAQLNDVSHSIACIACVDPFPLIDFTSQIVHRVLTNCTSRKLSQAWADGQRANPALCNSAVR